MKQSLGNHTYIDHDGTGLIILTTDDHRASIILTPEMILAMQAYIRAVLPTAYERGEVTVLGVFE